MANNKFPHRYIGSISVGAGQTSAPVTIPPLYEALTVGATPGAGGTLNIQYSLADPEDVVTDPNSVQWYQWDDGPVSSATARVLTGSITSIRAVAVGQPGKAEIVARLDR